MSLGNLEIIVPEGQSRIAQRLNAGVFVALWLSPEGTSETWRLQAMDQPSLRDSNAIDHFPGVETPGYSRDVPPGHVFIEFPNGVESPIQ